MIAKKTKTKATPVKVRKALKTQIIKTKKNKPKAVKVTKKRSTALHTFFKVGGFLLVVGALISPMVAHAKQGVYIVEPFSCEVALADYHHLTKTTKEDNPKFVQEQLEISLEATIKELAEHLECGEVQDGN